MCRLCLALPKGDNGRIISLSRFEKKKNKKMRRNENCPRKNSSYGKFDIASPETLASRNVIGSSRWLIHRRNALDVHHIKFISRWG